MSKTINNAIRLKREILLQTIDVFLQDKPFEKLEEIPYRIIPDGADSYRCCIHKDRAVIRSRILSVLGYGFEDIDKGPVFLAEYAKGIEKRKNFSDEVVTVIGDACSSCVETGYSVTEACRGCLARPCVSSCPVDAISFIDGKSVIDKSLCINCGKCAGVCPFSAIINKKAPCTLSCPADAIVKTNKGLAEIDRSKCINCGQCIVSCPFAAVVEKSQVVDLILSMKRGVPINVLVAPSHRGQFPGSSAQLYKALGLLGFKNVVEISEAAEECAKEESMEFLEKKDSQPFMTTSCCPAWVSFANKHLPTIVDKISHTASPMAIAADRLKKSDPYSLIAFIGPCTAKKNEAREIGSVDFVLSFEEVAMLLVSKGIDVLDLEIPDQENLHRDGTKFAFSGGVTSAVEKFIDKDDLVAFKPIQIDGLNKKNKALLKAASMNKNAGNFYEIMACAGGCVAGPGTICPPEAAVRKINNEK
ncbi:MAG: 4Fe-4S binding protein [Spirochaetales bacterium]|nr:4Fe-4S binding protein [Spirochaetales bacterium]